MSTTPPPGGSTQPEIPLSLEVREAYEQHYKQYEDAIENTDDPTLRGKLMAPQYAVDKVISADNTARIQQTSAAFQAVLDQLKTTNSGLSNLEKEIQKIAGGIDTYASILSGIGTILTLVPGI